MIEVKIKYKWLFFWRTKIRNIPTSYKEMSLSQFQAILKLSKGWMKELQFYCQYFGVSERLLSKLDIFQLYMLTQQVRIMEQNKGIDFFIVKQIGNLLAPDDRLENMSFQQFITVDQLYSWYIYTEKREYLDRMMAALYIEKKGNFFDNKFNERLEFVRKQKEEDLYGAVVNWMLIKNWLSSSYKHIFPEIISNGKNKKKVRPGSWLAIFDAMVGDNLAFINEYKHLPAMDAIRIINRKIKEQKNHVKRI